MLREYPLKVYGQWAGNPKGIPYDPDRCAYQVIEERGVGHQCQRRSKLGIWCYQHHPDAIQERRDKAAAKYFEEVEASMRPHNKLKAYRRALRAIARGTGDLRRTALQVLEAWEDDVV